MAIHLVSRKNNRLKTCIPITENGKIIAYETGVWYITEKQASKHKDLYLHNKQNSSSDFGGRILSYRIAEEADIKKFNVNDEDIQESVRNGKRLVIKFQQSNDHIGIEGGNWGNECGFV